MATHQHQVFLATGLLLLAVTMAASDDLILDADSEDNYTLKPGDQAMVVEPGTLKLAFFVTAYQDDASPLNPWGRISSFLSHLDAVPCSRSTPLCPSSTTFKKS